MALPDLAPRRTIGGIVAVWAAAALAALVIGLLVPAGSRVAWLSVGFGGCLLLAFSVQLAYGRAKGFTERVAASVVGAALVMGIVSLGFGLPVIVPG